MDPHAPPTASGGLAWPRWPWLRTLRVALRRQGLPHLRGLSLFWRTFVMLALLLACSALAWLQTFRALEFEPRAMQTAQQIATLVNLSRAALVHADAIARISLIKTLAEQEGVRVLPREAEDEFEPFDTDPLSQRVASEVKQRLGSDTVMARSVNGEEALWVGFGIEGDAYWLLMDRERLIPVGGRTWVTWLLIAALFSLAGAALIAGFVNKPLKALSRATGRVRDGDFDGGRLSETAWTPEIREVNIGFNRMAQQLAKLEQDRTVMMAGISHDLRTPLARLRLETELSVADATARQDMVADIEQLDGIISKFMDYARPGRNVLAPVPLAQVVAEAGQALRQHSDLHLSLDVPEALQALADPVELARVITNLLENARRYGKSPGQDHAEVLVRAGTLDEWVLVEVSDQGPGVPAEQLPHLTQPFFRGDTARTAATGTGLGLAIVDKSVQRMGGQFRLGPSASGGLAAHIQLRRAPDLV